LRDFHFPGRSAVIAAGGMCATSHPLAARVATDILKAGGNAADAAIAAAMTLNVCEPQMCGLGGDAFALIKPAGGESVVALNGSGRAPAGFDAEALRARGLRAIPERRAEAVTIPGAVDALCRLSADWGRMPLAEALAPAIQYAEAGVPVAPRVATDWARSAENLQGVARDHYLAGGAAPRMGQIFRAPRQAEVLRRIAAQGRAGFYDGEVAEDMVRSLQAHGGAHTLADFTATGCETGAPLRSRYNGIDLLEHPPNGQGATANLLLNILSHFDMAALPPLGPARLHLQAEAAKLAYDARERFLADPDHTARLAHMLAPETAARLAALIDPRRALPQPVGARTESIHRETVYLCVVDESRMAVSLIYSIFHDFGSGIASDKFGILFQNRGAGFTLERGHPNEAGPGKRPMHTIIPAMLAEGGRVTMPFGVMGGQYQPVGHAHVVGNLRDHGMDIQQAIDAPRAFATEGKLFVERGISPDAVQALADLGHDVALRPVPLGGGQAIVIDHENGVLIGASDPRKDGCAIGY
jgi:gamma-glutamyltranspeptidase/glutathione hydrolase